MPGGQALGSESLGRPSVPEPIGMPSRDSFPSATTPSTETPPPNDTTGGVEPLHIPLRIPALVGLLGLGYSGGQADPSGLRLVVVNGTNLGCAVSQFSTQSPQHTFPLSVFHSNSPTHLNCRRGSSGCVAARAPNGSTLFIFPPLPNAHHPPN